MPPVTGRPSHRARAARLAGYAVLYALLFGIAVLIGGNPF